jgi:Leucine-rich repeat (LRR) protein
MRGERTRAQAEATPESLQQRLKCFTFDPPDMPVDKLTQLTRLKLKPEKTEHVAHRVLCSHGVAWGSRPPEASTPADCAACGAEEAVVLLAPHLCHLRSLLQLKLHGCPAGGRGLVALCKHLPALPQLEDLTISGTRISAAGGAALAAALGQMPALRTLDVRHNALSAAGATALAAALGQMPALRTLNCYYNAISHSGAKALVDAASRRSGAPLQLNLNDNALSKGPFCRDEGLRAAVVAARRSRPELRVSY